MEPSDRIGPIAAVVLAAGTSSRMGENKLLLRLDGETMLRRAVGQALRAGLDPVLVVVGHEAERAIAELKGMRCRPVLHSDYARGFKSSLHAGMAALPPEAAALVVLLADMPLVTSAMIAKLVASYRAGGAPLVVSDYGGINAPPTLYDRALFGELLTMEGERCGKQVVQRHKAEALTVSWPAQLLTDIDVPADYERIRAELAVG
jgi:molybdenum cofactor cytidylyltransferase